MRFLQTTAETGDSILKCSLSKGDRGSGSSWGPSAQKVAHYFNNIPHSDLPTFFALTPDAMLDHKAQKFKELPLQQFHVGQGYQGNLSLQWVYILNKYNNFMSSIRKLNHVSFIVCCSLTGPRTRKVVLGVRETCRSFLNGIKTWCSMVSVCHILQLGELWTTCLKRKRKSTRHLTLRKTYSSPKKRKLGD